MYDSLASHLAVNNWPFSLEWLPQPAYMVGGAVRDAILGRSREYWDLDFIIPSGAVKIARAIAKHYQAGFVLLDAERQIARVVFPQATADFAQQEGDSLITDLHRRDFTINAIAYNPHTQEIIDPLQGCADIKSGLLRMISCKNLQDDPLRLMRAYRQAAQLGFIIEPTTQTVIRALSADITQVAAERVRVEIGYLLANSQGTPWLKAAWEDGLLTKIFPNVTAESLQKVAAIDQAYIILSQNWQQLGQELSEYIRDTTKTTWLGIAKLACLVNPNPEIAEIQLQELTYSRVENKAVTTAMRLFPQCQKTDMSIREQYFFFREAGNVFRAIALLALINDILIEEIAPMINRYLTPDNLVAHPTPLLTGKEIIAALEIPASPEIGRLLTEIAVAQAEGKISTAAEAIELAKQL
ncbi:CCA tRNA nucleotidyltransferase [Cronbergia sp. UHCC 0137]|uniref:CCA tRNA nucleotidyltransferase n=1 Tax=Cronbergia sp. UHCC 0137 TaxID=3110239 RepID=UPI002B21DBD8|nr:CCA tRNA nucleotidyltransferase [Cronbergia sp. UHCC 0137]MEA5617460.1 CCA tRNA nucleotidyltransferase [Cronbergia sp. UHCC 0137]